MPTILRCHNCRKSAGTLADLDFSVLEPHQGLAFYCECGAVTEALPDGTTRPYHEKRAEPPKSLHDQPRSHYHAGGVKPMTPEKCEDKLS